MTQIIANPGAWQRKLRVSPLPAGCVMDSQLLDFTRRALAAGLPRSKIQDALRQAGWPEPEIGAALGAYAEVEFPVPVPRARPYLSAREVFNYLVLFAALYVTAYNTGALLFHLIDLAFPTRLDAAIWSNQYLLNSIRWNISAILVGLPLFLALFQHVNKAIATDPTKRGSRPRLWLTYVTLFIAGMLVAGDVVALVYNALGGELGARLLLKVATVGVIGGGILGYFLRDVQTEKSP